MSVVDDYVAGLQGEEQRLITHMYEMVRAIVPDAEAGISYGMAAYKYKG